MKNLSEVVVNEICNEASRDISMMTSDIIADAMIEAVQAGANVGSADFIEELKAVRTGPTYEVITDSGRTDFSDPPFPMLPRLLKSGKVAKDGSIYKVIPMKEKSTGNRLAVTTEAAIANINNARRIAKEQRDAQRENVRGSLAPDALKGMDIFAAMQAINRSRQQHIEKETDGAPVKAFRTASSKQDANSKWVMPAKSKDVTTPMRDINMRLHDDIDRAIEDVIRRYEGAY
jgi:hypothetical protein